MNVGRLNSSLYARAKLLKWEENLSNSKWFSTLLSSLCIYVTLPKITCDVQRVREPYQSDVILFSLTVVAFMGDDSAHRVSRVKEGAR